MNRPEVFSNCQIVLDVIYVMILWNMIGILLTANCQIVLDVIYGMILWNMILLTDEFEIVKVIRVDVRGRVDLKRVVVLVCILKQAVHRVQHLHCEGYKSKLFGGKRIL